MVGFFSPPFDPPVKTWQSQWTVRQPGTACH